MIPSWLSLYINVSNEMHCILICVICFVVERLMACGLGSWQKGKAKGGGGIRIEGFQVPGSKSKGCNLMDSAY